MHRKKLLVLSLAAAFAAPVFAQSAGRGLEAKDLNPAAPSAGATAGNFSALDRNGDGYISRDEAAGSWDSRYGALDKDRDGRVSQSEFDAAQGAAGSSADMRSTTGGMGGSVGAGGTQSGSSTAGVGDKPGEKQ